MCNLIQLLCVLKFRNFILAILFYHKERIIPKALWLKLSQRSTWPYVETWGKYTKTTISNDPCEFIYRFRHTLDTLLSTHGHSIHNNVVYVINCYFKFDEKTPRPSFLMCGVILGEQVYRWSSTRCRMYVVAYMAVGDGGRGWLAPPFFSDIKKSMVKMHLNDALIGVTFEIFWKVIRLASLAVLIIKQQFKNQYYFTKMFN